jgi:asparagine synthase (glutamine-hydrolysing)
MCGIAGILQLSASFNKDHVKRMTTALAHRGPEGEKSWQNANGQILFGHRRLSVIDLSEQAAQPMHYLDRYTIVYNGEIYNYRELRAGLQQKGYVFHTASDTEVILAAFDHYNDECVEHFDGMFSFAIWDEKEQELFAARDRFGEKPFFYHVAKGLFVFASEMKAIWAAGIPRVANLKMLFNFITIGYTDNPEIPEETFFENIVKLPAASRLYYSPATGELCVEKYWQINPSIQDLEIKEREAIERFQSLFSTSIERRLRSDVKVGTSLSGGLDSSSVVAMIADLSARHPSADTSSLNAFTAIFPGFEKDEHLFSKQVSDQFNLCQHTIDLSANNLVDDWSSFCHHQEEPVGSASAYVQYKVFESAKEHGVTVLLDGQGADEILAGYHKYYKWYWQELFRQRRLLRSGELRAAKRLGIKEQFGVKNIIASLFPDIASVVLEKQYLASALRHEDLTRDFVKLQSKEAYYAIPSIFDLNGVLHFNTFEHGLEELLRYADRNSMAHGREVRLPFLSHEVVEFMFSLPSNFKIKDGWTKWLLRKTMEHRLPSGITWRKDKVGFEPPQETWMHDPRLREMIHEAKKKMVKEKILQQGVIDKPIRPHSAHAANSDDWKYLSAAWFL